MIEIKLTQHELGDILHSLNNTFHICMEKLEKMDDLGTIERVITKTEMENSLKLLKKLEKYE